MGAMVQPRVLEKYYTIQPDVENAGLRSLAEPTRGFRKHDDRNIPTPWNGMGVVMPTR